MGLLSRSRGRVAPIAVTLAATITVLSYPAAAQPGPPNGRRGGIDGRRNPGGPSAAPAEIQRMLDGYEVMQAQQMLQIGDEQFPRFLPRLRLLQEARRRAQMQRYRAIQELRRRTQSRSTLDEARVKETIKAFDDLDARSANEIKHAREALDQVLDSYQQARFRVFEDAMERRKVELFARARQANRQNRLRNQPVP